MTRRAPRTVLALLVLAVGLAGCSSTSKQTCNPFLPTCPTPTPTTGSSPNRTDPPDFTLSGTLTGTDATTARIDSQLWLGQTRQTVHDGQVRVQIPVSGSVGVTNTGPGPNSGAASVYLNYLAGYPRGSAVCELAVQPSLLPVRGRSINYCWQIVAAAAPYTYQHGPVTPMRAGQTQTVRINPGGSLYADVPTARAAEVADHLRHPAVVVAATGDIPILGADYRFRGACREILDEPSTASSGPNSGTLRRALVGSNRSVSCTDLGW